MAISDGGNLGAPAGSSRWRPGNLAAGHECQREAPACWPATLLRGGVLRVTTGPTASAVRPARTRQRGSTGPEALSHMSIATPPPPALRRTAPLANARDHLRAVRPVRIGHDLPPLVSDGLAVPTLNGTVDYAN